MGSIIDRALDIINDHLKDQTSSFQVASPLAAGKAMARGGHVLEDDYPNALSARSWSSGDGAWWSAEAANASNARAGR